MMKINDLKVNEPEQICFKACYPGEYCKCLKRQIPPENIFKNDKD